MRPPTSSNYSNSGGGGGGGATTSSTTTADMKLPPGFRFYPTDEELVVQYLCPKTAGKMFPPHIIGDIDLYKYDPWELPSKALFGESEWYFFSPRDRKYPNGSRPNRGAGSGYWKATGTDKLIKDHGRKVGIKKALVFYVGKAPKGTKTNWIMHEYRILAPTPTNSRINPNNYPAPAGSSPNSTNLLQDKTKAAAAGSLRLDDWVLCRIYKKLSGAEKIAGAGGPYDVVGESSSAGSFFSDDIHDVFSSLGDINSTMFPTAPAPLKVEDYEQQHDQYYTNYNISDHHQQQLDQFIDGTTGSFWNNNNNSLMMMRSNSLKKMDLEMLMRLQQQQQKQLQAVAAADHQEQFHNNMNMSCRSNNIVDSISCTTDHEHDMGRTPPVVAAGRRDDQDGGQHLMQAGGDTSTEAAAAAACSSSMMMMNGSVADQKEKELGGDDHHMSLRRQVSGGGRLYRQPSFPWLVDPILLEPCQLDQLL